MDILEDWAAIRKVQKLPETKYCSYQYIANLLTFGPLSVIGFQNYAFFLSNCVVGKLCAKNNCTIFLTINS